LDFNFIKQFGCKGSTNQQFDGPLGITFDENSIYVCDSENKRIQKLSQELYYQESYPLNYIPWNIKITKNVACIRSYGEPNNSLYFLNPFSFKARICFHICEIYSIDSWFYINNNFAKRIECYNVNGILVDSKDLDNVYEVEEQSYSFGYFNSAFKIGPSKTKKIKII
jgi:hypothetical protein